MNKINQTKKHILLYSNGCPKCQIIKEKLQKKDIKFSETDDMEKLVSLGYKTLPMLEVDGKFMDFKLANDWIEERGKI